jgi:hypothetical protein
VIDHPEQVERLLTRIRAALPMPARMTPRLMATLREQNPDLTPMAACRITRVDYAGDEGGIVCHLARDGEDESGRLVVTSITHLDFDPRLPLARDIAAYQKHRIKRLKRAQHARPAALG